MSRRDALALGFKVDASLVANTVATRGVVLGRSGHVWDYWSDFSGAKHESGNRQ